MAEVFEILIKGDGDTTVLALRGEFDLSNAGMLDGVVDGVLVNPTGLIVIDATELEFLDAAGVTPLVRLANLVGGSGSRIVAVGANPIAAIVLRTTPIALVDPLADH